MNQLMLRRATPADAKLYFNWVNDPDARKNALNHQTIEWEDHLKWFNEKLKSKSILLLLFESDTPVGQIRFDHKSDKLFYLDYSIDKKNRGQGLGKYIVKLSLDYLENINFSATIIAQVKKDNLQSNKVFLGTPFNLRRELLVDNILINEYEYSF